MTDSDELGPHASPAACDQIEDGEHIRVVSYRCPQCGNRGVVRISANLSAAAFRCVGCGKVIQP